VLYHRHGQPSKSLGAIIPDAIPVMKVIFGELRVIGYDEDIGGPELVNITKIWPMVWLVYCDLDTDASFVVAFARGSRYEA